MTLPGPVVDAAWLADALGHDHLVVADVRWSLAGPGRADYEAGHIPGAVFVDLDRSLAGPRGPGTGRHPLPAPTAFAAAMSKLGIGDDDEVVAYDDASGSTAARLWWMLTASGHRAAVLDGGISAWPDPLATEVSTRAPADFSCPPWPTDLLASTDDIEQLQRQGAVLLDARAPERYRGEVEPIDPRPGHIPGAINAPWTMTAGPDGRLLEPGAIRARYEALGVDTDTEVVAYCGSGVNACHLLLTRAAAGLPPGRLYADSWSAWCADPGRPAAVGPGG